MAAPDVVSSNAVAASNPVARPNIDVRDDIIFTHFEPQYIELLPSARIIKTLKPRGCIGKASARKVVENFVFLCTATSAGKAGVPAYRSSAAPVVHSTSVYRVGGMLSILRALLPLAMFQLPAQVLF